MNHRSLLMLFVFVVCGLISPAQANNTEQAPQGDIGYGQSVFPRPIGSLDPMGQAETPAQLKVATPPRGLSEQEENDPDRIAGYYKPPTKHLAPLDVLRAEILEHAKLYGKGKELPFETRIVINGPEVMASSAVEKGDYRLIRQSTGYPLREPAEKLWKQPHGIICTEPVPVIDVDFGCIGAPFSQYRALLKYNEIVYSLAPDTIKSACRLDTEYISKNEKYELERAKEWERRQRAKQ